MSKQLFTSLFTFFFCFLVFAQEDGIEETSMYTDKSKATITERKFENDLPSTYNGNEFTYKDSGPKQVKETKQPPKINMPTGIFSVIVGFFKLVFPYLLAALVIFIVAKSILGGEGFAFGKKKKKIERVSILSSEEESYLKDKNYAKLLEIAKQKGDFRMATRYYYLLLLQKMSDKELITYDKDKTNSEYIFDLQKKDLRKQFSYLLYIYDYVWYGEFNVDQSNFQVIETNYESFIKKL